MLTPQFTGTGDMSETRRLISTGYILDQRGQWELSSRQDSSQMNSEASMTPPGYAPKGHAGKDAASGGDSGKRPRKRLQSTISRRQSGYQYYPDQNSYVGQDSGYPGSGNLVGTAVGRAAVTRGVRGLCLLVDNQDTSPSPTRTYTDQSEWRCSGIWGV